MRREAKKKAKMRDKKLEAVWCNAQKKVQALDAQLNHEHEERTLPLREKHELEKCLSMAIEPERLVRVNNKVLLQGLKKDLKKTKTLLRERRRLSPAGGREVRPDEDLQSQTKLGGRTAGDTVETTGCAQEEAVDEDAEEVREH